MGSNISILRSILVAAVFVTAGQALSEPREIGFSDLPDPVVSNFRDPFREMGFKMLGELRTVVRLETQLRGKDVPADARPRLEDRLLEARNILDANGYDIESLVAQRWTIAEQRKQAFTAINSEVSGAEIIISGYFIPAGLDGGGSPIGYLVSEIGLCGHKPPPPPNQLIRVQLNSPLPHTSLYQPLEITGVLRTEDSMEAVFVLDGDVPMASRWKLQAQTVDLKVEDDRYSDLTPWAQSLREGLKDKRGN